MTPSLITAQLLNFTELKTPAKLYRVGLVGKNANGLWYDFDGNYLGDINKLEGAAAAQLAMGPHPIFRDRDLHWMSATSDITDLSRWFSTNDMRQLYPQGYRVLEIDVPDYRYLTFEGYAHEVFARESVKGWRELDPSLVYADLFKDAAA